MDSLNKVRPKDKEAIAGRLKGVYWSRGVSGAKGKLLKLQEEIKSKYPRLLDRWFKGINRLMRHLEFPEYLRGHLYSTNWVGRLDKDLREVVKNKGALPTEPTEDAVRNLLYLKIRDISARYER